MSAPNIRAQAAKTVAAVLQHGASLDTALAQTAARLGDDESLSLLKELCYGTLRWRFRLEAPLATLLRRPFRARDTDVHALLLVGLYQIIYMRTPDHAAVAETVNGVRGLKKNWARGLVNATLRNFLRQKTALLAAADEPPTSRYAYPQWLLERLRTDWPDDWHTIAQAGNERAPMVLRVNRTRTTPNAMQARLAEASIPAHTLAEASDALVLKQATAVEAIPGFAAGDVSVQDGGAQLAADVLDARPGQRVLDACAAPGGKTGHILERCPELTEVVALDVAPKRVQHIHENLQRLQLQATVKVGDACAPKTWWAGAAFDRILLDAPCSGSGVIRRHPDIKSLRRAGDIGALVARQAQLLDALWPLLAPGGRLVYVTCSILRAENDHQMADFLSRTPDAHAHTWNSCWGKPVGVGQQLWPDGETDGFFYARIQKLSS